MTANILVIEDDPVLARNLVTTLTRSGFNADSVLDGEQAVEKLLTGKFDLALLDLMIPKINGYEVLKQIHVQSIDVAVIVVSAKGGEYDQADALDLGADDFIVKPFNAITLESRINAVLRRSSGTPSSLLKGGELSMDISKRECMLKGQEVSLSKIEFDLLWCLMRAEGAVVRRVDIEDEIWGNSTSSNLLDVYMGYLRKKIGSNYFEVFRGHGIRFNGIVETG